MPEGLVLHNIYIKNTHMGYSIAKYISYSHNWYILPQLALVALESLPKKKHSLKKTATAANSSNNSTPLPV